MIRGVLLDLSGVLYIEDCRLPGAKTAINKLIQAGLPVRYITNTTRKTTRTVLRQMTDMQFYIKPDELFTASVAARNYLKQHGLRPYLLIHPALEEEFADFDQAGAINAVLIGDAAQGFTYARMNRAFRYLMDGAEFLALGINRYFRESDGLSLDAGPFVQALEYATGRQANVIGKPSADFYMSAVGSMGCDASDVMMVGDDVESDVNGAIRAGLQGLLVMTGKFTAEDEGKILPGGLCCADISEAVETILQLA